MKYIYLIALCIVLSSCATGGRGDRDGGSARVDTGLRDVVDYVKSWDWINWTVAILGTTVVAYCLSEGSGKGGSDRGGGDSGGQCFK